MKIYTFLMSILGLFLCIDVHAGRRIRVLDPYQVIQVQKGSSRKAVRKAFREAVRKHHPDVGGSTEKMQEVNQAYDKIMRSFDEPSKFSGTKKHDDFASDFFHFDQSSSAGVRPYDSSVKPSLLHLKYVRQAFLAMTLMMCPVSDQSLSFALPAPLPIR